MSTEQPFQPYEVSIGTVTGHELGTTPAQYLVRTPDGRVMGVPANGAPSSEAFETDLANPPAAPLPVPQSIRNAQLRQQLAAMDLLSTVDAVVSQAGLEAQIRWEYEVGVNRADPLVAAIGQVLNLTDSQIDDIFRAAAQIP